MRAKLLCLATMKPVISLCGSLGSAGALGGPGSVIRQIVSRLHKAQPELMEPPDTSLRALWGGPAFLLSACVQNSQVRDHTPNSTRATWPRFWYADTQPRVVNRTTLHHRRLTDRLEPKEIAQFPRMRSPWLKRNNTQPDGQETIILRNGPFPITAGRVKLGNGSRPPLKHLAPQLSPHSQGCLR
ncbi:unnamed protein product [Gadus morhua 'NCC']